MISFDDLIGLRVPFLQQRAALSPDGHWFAAVVRSLDAESGGGDYLPSGAPYSVAGASIVIVEIESGSQTRLVPGARSWSPRWGPKGDHLAFLCDAGGRVQVWGWRPGESQPAPLHEHEVAGAHFGEDAPQWLPDGERLLLQVRRKSASGPPGEGRLPNATATLVDILVNVPGKESRSAHIGPSDEDRCRDLAVLDLNSGQWRHLEIGGLFETGVISSDGTTIAFQSPTRWPDLQTQEVTMDVAIAKLDPSVEPIAPRYVAEGLSSSINDGRHLPAWSPDGRSVALCATEGIRLIDAHSFQSRLIQTPSPLGSLFLCWASSGEFVIAADTAKRLWRIGITDDGIWGLDAIGGRPLTPQGGCVLASVHDPAVIVQPAATPNGYLLRSVPTDGGTAKTILEDDVPFEVIDPSPIWGALGDISDDGRRIVYTRALPDRPAPYWIFEDGSSREILELNPSLPVRNTEQRVLRYQSRKGRNIGSHVLVPTGAELPLPTVVKVYPGKSVSTNPATWDIWDTAVIHGALLTSAGYAVAVADLPSPIFGGAKMNDLDDVLEPTIAALVEAGISDPDRICLVGHSGGGHAVALAATLKTSISAFIAAAGVANLTSRFGSFRIVGPDIASMRGISDTLDYGGPPWSTPSLLDDSPVFRADRIEAPVLLIHGTEDEAVPVTQSDELYAALSFLDRDVTYLRYRGENHSFSTFRVENRRHLANFVIGWLGSRLGDTRSTE